MNNIFYSLNNDKPIIFRSKLLEFWKSEGFRKIKMPKGAYILAQISKSSIIKQVTNEDLMSAVRKKLLEVDDQPRVWEEFLKGDYINKNNYLALEQITDLDLNVSSKEVSYFFFKNGIVKVTPTDLELVDYENYSGYVLEDQIIPHNLILDQWKTSGNSMFSRFLGNVVNNNEDRLKSLRSAIGYSIHSYKDPSLTKAVIFVDEEIDFSGEANGGTGKSLIAKGIAKMVHSIFKDGKALHNRNNRFFYQDVTIFHRMMILDDVNTDFNFEDFYSVITGEMSVEEKFKSSYIIPHELSPKLVITSNYMIKGSGGESDQRRRIEIEIYPKYSVDFSPFDDFGVRFFNDWNDDEYNLFYLDMLKCCQLFLTEGVIMPIPINLAENKLKLHTDYSFVEYVDLKLDSLDEAGNLTFNKETLYSEYRDKYPIESKNITAIRFKKWLDLYGNSRKLDVYQYKSNSQNMVRISKRPNQ